MKVRDPHGVVHEYKRAPHDDYYLTDCKQMFHEEVHSPEWRDTHAREPLTCIQCIAQGLRDVQDRSW